MSDQKNPSYLRGAAVLATTVAFVKIIGALYKIPLYNLLGDEGTTHFQVTYSIYSLLLTLSTAGIPVAISRLVAEANALNRPRQAKKYFSVSLIALSVIGLLFMGLMLVFPSQLASLMGDPEIPLGLMALAPAVLFSCVVSVYRGYSQGYSNMVPTALSQVLEVLCKFIFGLAIAWLLARRHLNSATVSAGAIVGVTIGLGLAIPVLMYFKRRIDRTIPKASLVDTPDPFFKTLRRVFAIGIPITLCSSIFSITVLIDTKLILARLQNGAGFSYQDAKILYGAYSKSLTLYNMPNAFIVPITTSIVPAISAALARKNHKEAKAVMESALKVVNLFAIPAGIGLTVLSTPIFNMLYPDTNAVGPTILAVHGIASYLICMHLTTGTILQASGHEKLSLITLPVGGIVTILCDWILVGLPQLNIVGAPISTIICYTTTSLLNICFIRSRVKSSPDFWKITAGPLFCAVIMGAAAWGSFGLLSKIAFFASSRLGLIISLVGAILLAVVIYVILVIFTGTIKREDMQFVPKGDKIANLLRLK